MPQICDFHGFLEVSREYVIISSPVVTLGQFTLNIIDSSGDSTHFIFLAHRKILKIEKVTICFRKSEVEISEISRNSTGFLTVFT